VHGIFQPAEVAKARQPAGGAADTEGGT
jgi:hypothetical protein